MIVYVETLGCSRNQVDSEVMLGKLMAAGHTHTLDPARADAIVVNTCSFISTAAEEAVDTILALARYQGARGLPAGSSSPAAWPSGTRMTRISPAPCQRWSVEFVGTGACEQIVDVVENATPAPLTLFPNPDERQFADLSVDRILSGEPPCLYQGIRRMQPALHLLYYPHPAGPGSGPGRSPRLCQALLLVKKRGGGNYSHSGKYHEITAGSFRRHQVPPCVGNPFNAGGPV
ncbi:MAG: hypothetical protein U5K27_01815 [Desulfotignum sp.]|nr:hypothetical protein [Desulfotignum sp.]